MAWSATPVVEDPLKEGAETKVRPLIPTGKVLLFPVSAYDDAGQLTITATSSNPKVLVRVKTGNPLMKFVITHGGATGDPAYTETAVFHLFRDLAPETVGYIGGFAQSGFYDTGNSSRIFRLADFGAVDGQPQHSFIFQGGSNTGTGTGDVGFNFDNEFSPSALFSGSGQIAMANSGYDTFKRGSNGSQYFITDGNVRVFLDYKHTIFGQLTHGFAALRKLRETPLLETDGDSAPKLPIQVTSSSIVPQYIANGHTYTDAVLVLSATAPGTSVITVTAANAQGLKGQQTFTVTVADDPRTLNTRPFMTPLPDGTLPKSTRADLGFRVIDLERDFIQQESLLVSNGTTTNPKALSALIGNATDLFSSDKAVLAYQKQGLFYRSTGDYALLGNSNYVTSTGTFSVAPYAGPIYPTVDLTQYEPTYRPLLDGAARGVDNSSGSTVAVGESPLISETTALSGAPGVATSFVVASYRDTDPHGQASEIAAKINWGDGTTPITGAVGTDPLKPSSTGYQISGTHTYARAGTYELVTVVTSTGGLLKKIRNTAVITTNSLKAVGVALALPGPSVINPILATFTDPVHSTPAAGYVATVDWGDGVVAPGVVRAAGPGKFTVIGKHVYLNSERFSVSVRVHRSGSAAAEDSVAWSSITLTKAFGVQHLPPFNCAHLVAGVTEIPVSHGLAGGPMKDIKTTVVIGANKQTYLNYSVQIVNAGNLASKTGKMRFYLSADKTVNTTAVGTNPADIPLKVLALNTNEFFLPALQPGQAVQYYFEKSQYADYRLVPPKNETGTGHNFLVQLDYTDPIADHLPIDKVAVAGKINGILVNDKLETVFVATRESGTTDFFNVSLDKAPKADVTVPIAIASGGTAEGTLDKTSLIFTKDNWSTAQKVTVTGKSDTPATSTSSTNGRDGSKTYFITVGYSTSTDPLFSGLQGPSVQVSNADRDGNLVLTNNLTTYTLSELLTSSAHSRDISLTFARAPKEAVTVAISSSDTTEGEIIVPGGTSDMADPNKKILTVPGDATAMAPFTKTFTIRSKDDRVRDGNQTFTVKFEVKSNDKEFDGLTLPTLTITNTDDGLAQ